MMRFILFGLLWLGALTYAFESQQNSESMVRVKGKVLSLSSLESKGLDAHQGKYQADLVQTKEPRENGVLIEFRTPSLLELRAQENGIHQSKKVLNSLIANHNKTIEFEHERFENELQLFLNKNNPMRSEDKKRWKFKTAFNGIYVPELSSEEAKIRFATHSLVKRVHPNSMVYANLMETVPTVKANSVWSFTAKNGQILDGTGIKIGILDTGIDYRHRDLGGCLGPQCKVQGGYDFVNQDEDPMDDHGHGTHVAAIAAGNGFSMQFSGSLLVPGIAFK